MTLDDDEREVVERAFRIINEAQNIESLPTDIEDTDDLTSVKPKLAEIESNLEVESAVEADAGGTLGTREDDDYKPS